MTDRSRLLQTAYRARRLYWRLLSPLTLGVRAIVADDDGRVLLVRHSYGRRSWYLPGGGVKRRERAAEAACRELREEVGIEVVGGPSGLQLLGFYSNRREGKSDHIAVFIVGQWQRRDVDPREIAEEGFFSIDDLPDEVSPGTRQRIEEWLGARPVPFDW